MKNLFSKIITLFKKVHPFEIVTTITIILVINYRQDPANPFFLYSRYNAYFIIILLFASFYGKVSGIMSLFLSIAGNFIALLILNYPLINLSPIYKIYHNGYQSFNFIQFIFLSVLLVFIFGEIHDFLAANNQKLKFLYNSIVRRNQKLQKELKAVSLTNEEYQDRILGQQNSLISLYSTMVSLNSLDLNSIYPNILDAVHKFSGALQCSLWEYKHEKRQLNLLASYGWDEELKKGETIIADDGNITGWAARNNVNFSVKMLQKHKTLRNIDKKQNIISVPIVIENQVWGIINIEKIPFIKYNLYSEQLIMMIADLAVPIIQNALRFSELSKKGEVDSVTGLHSIDEMFIMLKEEYQRALANKLAFSFLIIEISNHEDLLETYSKQDVLKILGEVTQLANELSKGSAMIFQYKETYQFCALLPNMDHDGAALFCLSIIEKHNKKAYSINKHSVTPEIIMGYSSLRADYKSEKDLIFLAENLLMIQKI